jgi:uncharacterized repeat protein (TIGR01451 family)
MKTINKKTTILTSITIATLLFAGSSFMGEQNAYAVSVPIDLPSFESPTLGDGEWTPAFDAHPTEWTFTGSGGVFNPTSTHMASEANSGENQAWSSGGSICQTLGTEITENTLYTLSAYVGARSDGETYDDFLIELLDENDVLLASLANTDGSAVDPTTGNWALNTLEHNVFALDPSVGDDLKICLSATTSQTQFDDVSLDAEPLQVVASCSDDDVICKEAVIFDADEDGVIEVGEVITYRYLITVTNDSGEDWTNVVVKDNFAANLDVIDPAVVSQGTAVFTQKGGSDKEVLSWDVGALDDGESANLVVYAVTDITPGGDQSYTECSYHDINSGANVKYRDERNKQKSFATDSLIVSVLTVDRAGDCDGDGFIDADEEDIYGTDPHDINDNPTCQGINTVDICIDGDGIASPTAGSPSDYQAVWLNSLDTWSTGFYIEGIDWFDMDGNDVWTPVIDAIHLEDPNGSCPTGNRPGALHDAGDCLVLDSTPTLPVGTPVSCDLESGTFCGATKLSYLATTGMKFLDSNGNNFWDNGEDIIIDTNGDGIFN